MSEMAQARLLSLLSKLEAASGGAATAAAARVRDALGSHGERAALAAGSRSRIPLERVPVVYNQPWTNFQGNLNEKVVERQYFVGNLPSNEWTCGVENVRLVVKESAAGGRSLRSMGSAWSSSPVSMTPLYLVHCGGLSGAGPAIAAADLAPGVDPGLIAHVQAGTIIQNVNELLESNGQSLKVMGGNAGQNIAGAAATGTHGSWIDRRALADTVHAIALVGAEGKPTWIEPASRPLTREGFTAWGVFEVVRDDSLFAAAQVSVGALGIVTSLVLDVDRLYFIDFTREKRELDTALRNAIYHLDLSGLGFGDRRPAHFEVVLNPYQLGAGQTGAFMETGFIVPPASERSDVAAQPPSFTEISAHLQGVDVWALVAELLSKLPFLVPAVLDLVLPYAFPTAHVVGPLSKVWPLSTGGPPLISTELAVPQEKVEETLNLLLSRLEAAAPGFYWPGVFGVRFGKKTGALLGFTRFDRWCTMELLYLRGVQGVEGFLRDFYAAMRAQGIEHGVHWGQVNFLTAEEVQSDYGEEALSRWRAARQRLGADGQTFANDATNAWGLTSTPSGEQRS